MDEMRDRLARLLSYTDKDADAAAETLIGKFESFYRIAQSNFEAVSELSSKNDAVLIRVIAALASRSVVDSFKFGREHTREEIERFLTAFFFDDSEEAVCFFPVDERGRLLSCERIGGGTVSTSEFSLRKIVGAMIKKNSKRVIIAHNHPEGTAEPSAADLEATELIRNILLELDRELVYHYIVSGSRVTGLDPNELA